MNKHDVIRFMGRFPDKIYSAEEAEKQRIMYAKKWICSQCGKIYEFDIETKIPVPCIDCGSIGFSKSYSNKCEDGTKIPEGGCFGCGEGDLCR